MGVSAGILAPVFALRPAVAEDIELCWRIQWTSLGAYIAEVYGTSLREQRAFFDEHFRLLDHQIIQVGGEDAGYLFTELRGDHLYLGNLALLEPFRNRGIGAEVVRHVIQETHARGLPVRLQVLRSNPARNFYVRLGFEQVGETSTHFRMLRPWGRPQGGSG